MLIFYFKTLIQISFLIFTAKLMLIILSYFWFVWWKCHNILLFVTLFHFICYIFILQLIFFQDIVLQVQKKFFSWTLKSHLLFSWWGKIWKVTITIYCCLITDPFPIYIFINFCSLESCELNFWIPEGYCFKFTEV